MFTGLIERVGRLSRRDARGDGVRMVIAHEPWATPLEPGESVAVQGACLTVTEVLPESFTCDVLHETLQQTGLGQMPSGAGLNLERALRAGDRVGGHFVTGHVDGVGRTLGVRATGADRVLRVGAARHLLDQIVERGSVACNGVSLTISTVTRDGFEVHIIPFTWTHTSLSQLRDGDPVNVETDMLGKYVRRHLAGARHATPLTVDCLRQAGFVPDDPTL